MGRILVAGETLVDFIPDARGSLPTVETFHRRAGGAPANVAVGLARLDVPPLFWTRIGDDPFGEFLHGTLVDAGVDDTYVVRDPTAKTSLVFVSLDPDAERSFSFHRDGTADTQMQVGALSDGDLAAVDWVHAGGVTLAGGSSREATFDLLERAGERDDVVVSFDPNARPELFTDHDLAGSFERAFAAADVVKTTVEDLLAAGLVPSETTDDDAAAVAETICGYGPHTTLVTRGANGALARAEPTAPWNPTGSPIVVEHPGHSVDVVDTTGAGDAYTAGAIASLAKAITADVETGPSCANDGTESPTTTDDGGSTDPADREDALGEALALANAVAARTTTARGAMTSLPSREEALSIRNRSKHERYDGPDE